MKKLSMKIKLYSFLLLLSVSIVATGCTPSQSTGESVTSQTSAETTGDSSDETTQAPTTEASSDDADLTIAAETITALPDHGMITDWLDASQVLIVKENTALDKLEALSESYPMSIYSYDMDDASYTLVEESENENLGTARMAPDGVQMLYSTYTLGDPAFYVMNLLTRERFRLASEEIAGAMDGAWTVDGTVVGAAYAGGAYVFQEDGTIEHIPMDSLIGLSEWLDGTLYYTSQTDGGLNALNVESGSTQSLPYQGVRSIEVSPAKDQMAIVYSEGDLMVLALTDAKGQALSQIQSVDGAVSNLSWSKDGAYIAYAASNQTEPEKETLYVYAVQTGKTFSLVQDIEGSIVSVRWSPSSDILAYSVWDDDVYTSYFIDLKIE